MLQREILDNQLKTLKLVEQIATDQNIMLHALSKKIDLLCKPSLEEVQGDLEELARDNFLDK